MSRIPNLMTGRDLVVLLEQPETLHDNALLKDLAVAYVAGDYGALLQGPYAQDLFRAYLGSLSEGGSTESSLSAAAAATSWGSGDVDGLNGVRVFLVGVAAFNAFLQANVTGPPLSGRSLLFREDLEARELSLKRRLCLASLDVDGLSVYQHIPHVELFCLARAIFTQYFPRVVRGQTHDSRWMRMRINVYHQRLLSSGTSNARLSDSAAVLQIQIDADMLALEQEILLPGSVYSTQLKVQFLLEKVQVYIMQGLDIKARENLQMARSTSNFSYALSGALGKRTKFQQKDTSQLVVLARSHSATAVEAGSKGFVDPTNPSSTQNKAPGGGLESANVPLALELNDDTLLESIEFSKISADGISNSTLPTELAELKPDEQPQLEALDQIILLTEATRKDTLSPLDKLNSEEILPYAVRVLNDKPTNWQVYTQALLVRSRIESHRSRTQERSVLQLQVIVDQIIADTQDENPSGGSGGIPQIEITSFIPRAKFSEAAPVTERLRFIHQLNTPTRWEIETELAYAWSGAGSLVSALEIFKRLKLWAEVALCYHSVGQEDKARQIVRRQLYLSSRGLKMDSFSIDAEEVVNEKWDGEVRSPPPPHAPRLWCILGDLDQDPKCWQRAWEISRGRYARAQRTLGEHYSRTGDLIQAREAYMKATVVNRQNGETWSRLGDVDLRVGNWDGAIVAFQQSIMIDDTDAKTFSNLGSALLSKYDEMMELQRTGVDTPDPPRRDEDRRHIEHDEFLTAHPPKATVAPKDILRQALTAYKRGATIAHSNWQIWDNVITVALRTTPPSHPDILLALRSIIHIRSPKLGEDSIDLPILHLLIAEVTSHAPTDPPHLPPGSGSGSDIYTPPRGTLAAAVLDLVATTITPLLTHRPDIYAPLQRLCLWRSDLRGALACAEKAYRLATTGPAWLEHRPAWQGAAAAADALVDALINYGPREVWVVVEGEGEGEGDGEGEGERQRQRQPVEAQWRAKARSALRAVLGRARDAWGETEEFELLRARLDDLKS